MKPNLTNLKPTVTTPNNQNEIKKVQEEVANLSPKIMEPQVVVFWIVLSQQFKRFLIPRSKALN